MHSTAQHSTAQHSTAQHSTAQHKSIIHRTKKSVVIAGNGKSLSQIDYNLLPADFDVFRCNQFYFEDHYFLGKEIKAAFFNSFIPLEQYYTFQCLNKNKEYQCENFVLSAFYSPITDLEIADQFKRLFPHIINGYDYLEKLDAFDQYLRFNELYEDKRITSGVYMCAVAIAAGYKEIYLTGVDFYTGGNTTYAFEHKQENILKLVPTFKQDINQSSFHTQNTDIEALQFLQENYGVKIYSISPSSPISEYFPVSPQQGRHNFNLEKKPENYTKDILIPSPEAYYKYHQIFPKKQKILKLHNNLVYRLIKDFLHLPSHIKHYLRSKRQK